MLDQSLIALLLLSLGLGVIHAFDADHVMAVSSLASRKRHWRDGLRFAALWALGHGGILLLVASAALLLDWQLPAMVGASAEKIVGIILIAAGASIFWSLYRHRLQLDIHRHGEQIHAHLTAMQPYHQQSRANLPRPGPVHLHVHPHPHPNQNLPLTVTAATTKATIKATAGAAAPHDHTPVLVGIVHGLAGSAPALALIPATLHNTWVGMGYVVLFSLGVLVGMGGFGLILGYAQRWLLNISPRLFDGSRLLLATAATGLGVIWING